jgi:hypothetical protein
MQGYGLRNSEGVSDPLFASALAVGSKELEWVLLCVDVIGMDRSLTHRIRQSAQRATFTSRVSDYHRLLAHTFRAGRTATLGTS